MLDFIYNITQNQNLNFENLLTLYYKHDIMILSKYITLYTWR